MNELLSVIVPVYNAGNYLYDCLNSIINQDYKNLEIIVINDGSKDNSLDIIKEIAAKDNRITVINRPNKGLPATRYEGVSKANGKYIAFVDQDDYIEKNTYQICMNEIEDNDILIYGVSCDFEKENYQIKMFLENDENKDVLLNKMLEKGIFNFAWNKIYKKDILNHEEYFPYGFNQGEDILLNCKVFKNVDKIKCIPDVLYHYMHREKETIINTFTKNNEKVLNAKQKSVLNLFGETSTYYDYMLKEYEVFVINLFMKGNNINYTNKVKLIKEYIINSNVIDKGTPSNLYGKIFKVVASTHNAHIIVIVYALLNLFKNIMGSFYLTIRKLAYRYKS